MCTSGPRGSSVAPDGREQSQGKLATIGDFSVKFHGDGPRQE